MNNIIRLITVLGNLVIIYFIYNLKYVDNECSKSIYADYIFCYSLVHVLLTALIFIVPSFFNERKTLSTLIKLVLGLGMIINIFCLYKYSQMLKKCKDINENLRMFMEYYSYFYICILVFMHIYLYDFYINNKNLRETIKKNTVGNITTKKIN